MKFTKSGGLIAKAEDLKQAKLLVLLHRLHDAERDESGALTPEAMRDLQSLAAKLEDPDFVRGALSESSPSHPAVPNLLEYEKPDKRGHRRCYDDHTHKQVKCPPKDEPKKGRKKAAPKATPAQVIGRAKELLGKDSVTREELHGLLQHLATLKPAEVREALGKLGLEPTAEAMELSDAALAGVDRATELAAKHKAGELTEADLSPLGMADLRALGVLVGAKGRSKEELKKKILGAGGGGEKADEKPEKADAVAKEPWEMTREEYRKAIDEAETSSDFMTKRTEDWGRLPRGQGKRSGYMVRGAMSAAPTGKVTYSELFGKLPEEQKIEADSLTGAGKVAYLKSRSAGFDHDHAMVAGYGASDDSIDPHRHAVEGALASGKPVPTEVLADYPDLAEKYGSGQKLATKAPDEAETWDTFRGEFERLNKESTVKIPELFDAMQKVHPGLTREDFDRLLLKWRADDRITLTRGYGDAEGVTPGGVEDPAGKGTPFYYVQGLNDAAPPAREKDAGPKDGDTKDGLVFRDGRWHKQGEEPKKEPEKPAEKTPEPPAREPGDQKTWQEQAAALDELTPEWTGQEKQDLLDWTGFTGQKGAPSYYEMNQALRSGDTTSPAAKKAARINERIRKTPRLKKPIKVYRGVGASGKGKDAAFVKALLATKPGDELTLDGIASTSHNPGLAMGFSGQGYNEHEALLEIRATQGVNVSKASGETDPEPIGAHEFLMAHGAKLRVVGHEQVKLTNGKTITKIIVEQVE